MSFLLLTRRGGASRRVSALHAAAFLPVALIGVACATGEEGAAPPPPTEAAAALPPPGISGASSGNDDGGADQLPRLREGTQLVDRLGRFCQNGEALAFVDEEGREIGGLPNLSLERVVRMLKSVEEPESVMWSVSGTITEFGGRNYLLVNRAVYKAAALPPAPESVGE